MQFNKINKKITVKNIENPVQTNISSSVKGKKNYKSRKIKLKTTFKRNHVKINKIIPCTLKEFGLLHLNVYLLILCTSLKKTSPLLVCFIELFATRESLFKKRNLY